MKQRKHSFIINITTDKPCTAGPAMKAIRNALDGTDFHATLAENAMEIPGFRVRSFATVKRGAQPELKTTPTNTQ